MLQPKGYTGDKVRVQFQLTDDLKKRPQDYSLAVEEIWIPWAAVPSVGDALYLDGQQLGEELGSVFKVVRRWFRYDQQNGGFMNVVVMKMSSDEAGLYLKE